MTDPAPTQQLAADVRACPFCDYEGPSRILREWENAYAIEPIKPVTPGHVLVIPKEHRATADESPDVTADTFYRAAELAREIGGDFNLIQSNGDSATQTVRHLHVHVVPRHEDDGLQLPWTADALVARITDLEAQVEAWSKTAHTTEATAKSQRLRAEAAEAALTTTRQALTTADHEIAQALDWVGQARRTQDGKIAKLDNARQRLVAARRALAATEDTP